MNDSRPASESRCTYVHQHWGGKVCDEPADAHCHKQHSAFSHAFVPGADVPPNATESTFSEGDKVLIPAIYDRELPSGTVLVRTESGQYLAIWKTDLRRDA